MDSMGCCKAMLMAWTAANNNNVRLALYIKCVKIRWDWKNRWERVCERKQSFFVRHKVYDQYLCSHSCLASFWFSAASCHCHRSTWTIGLLADIHKPTALITYKGVTMIRSSTDPDREEDVWKSKSDSAWLTLDQNFKLFCHAHLVAFMHYTVCTFSKGK